MKKLKILLLSLLILNISCSSITNKQNKGNVVPENFEYKTKFTTLKSVMILPFEINGVTKNFIFDTGADYSIIQRDSMIGKTNNYGGASKRKMRLGSEIILSMKINNIDFTNTFALNGDMKGLKEQIPNFGGIIGQSIIKKANWLIDYPNRTIKLSNKNIVDTNYETIKRTIEKGSPYTYITINETDYKVMVDFGSSADFNIPKESKLAKELLIQHNFSNNERERYTLGGLQKLKEKVGILPIIKLGNIKFENIKTTINSAKEAKIGIGFFKDSKIYIDNINDNYKIKK
ncbi:pepsin/retropepsin-like aspartic protease family protein [Polaribacter butkevichii]|uniref:Peptidase A2 domain-containing protein n=1 Tax=Polaribacter butkevichii TaxID=218490 RepID=A0A2P6CFG9_9FLAO|nr:retropepsin-like domain-containing protein [Polaribacter butkevichii]PQJ73634.1 hypothetical protein BTO14_10295 [Polaribacter butkevichii]